MKKTGFTLIELLAVIVILAIIALIATPTILGVIEKARKGASEQSALGYIDAVEKQVAINQLKNENLINDGTYNVPMTGITVKGEAPTKGWLKIEKGMVTNYSFVIGKYVVTKGSETVKGDEPAKTDEEVTEIYPVYSNGTAVYYNPETNEKCKESEAVSTTGTKTGCMKWYTFNDEGETTSTISMILDHNTTATVAWNTSESSILYENSSIKLEVDKLINEQNWIVTPRLITADEVAKITGNTKFNSLSATNSDGFYLDSNNQTQTATSIGTSKYAWLFDYTKECTNNGCNVEDSSNYGYWTSSSISSSEVWYINRLGRLDPHPMTRTFTTGIRPVITISKDIIQ